MGGVRIVTRMRRKAKRRAVRISVQFVAGSATRLVSSTSVAPTRSMLIFLFLICSELPPPVSLSLFVLTTATDYLRIRYFIVLRCARVTKAERSRIAKMAFPSYADAHAYRNVIAKQYLKRAAKNATKNTTKRQRVD